MFPYIFIIVGSLIILALGIVAFKAFLSNGWTETTGIILKSGKALRITESNTLHEKRSWKSLHIDMEYRYKVEGKEYRSTRVTFTDFVFKPESSLNKLLQEYIENKQIRVFYNPKNPEKSVLVQGMSIFNFTPMITAGLLIGAGVYMLKTMA
ncbi:DUF3592 domain-containing protein [Parashewanella spongiae]|uniref:DUF3592 domain-containing protein n=1 Tax=Parashewanella spongiae TaxID=342950 RepID=A0A3A6T235_9GAMM|nr:DUF3592 domain-containing protein [Parashewanella spongiae]MCL1080272.1 DUF3592 domain-containing protein [Parashewanella spongiae]RJY01634.1 DUF3592 domain-containing protein [Parashewanella spongiae]